MASARSARCSPRCARRCFGDAYRRAGLERLELSAAIRTERYEGGLAEHRAQVRDRLVAGSAPGRPRRPMAARSAPLAGRADRSAPRPRPYTLTAQRRQRADPAGLWRQSRSQAGDGRSWTTGLEYAPADRPLRINATLFDTKFENRIGQPAINNLSTVLTASDLAPFRQFINPAASASDLALVQSYLQYATSGTARSIRPRPIARSPTPATSTPAPSPVGAWI
jgi:hypothetical protein